MTTTEHTIKIKSEIDPKLTSFLESVKARDTIWWSVKLFEFITGVHIMLGVWRHW